MKKKVLYGFEHETLDAKIRWMLSLSVSERYENNLSFSEFLKEARKNRGLLDVRTPFKTIQVIKQK